MIPALTPLGLTRDERHVYGYNDGQVVRYPIPSVTTIIKLIDKSGPLVGWAKRETAARRREPPVQPQCSGDRGRAAPG